MSGGYQKVRDYISDVRNEHDTLPSYFNQMETLH